MPLSGNSGYSDRRTISNFHSALTMDAGLSVSAIAEAFERIDRIADDRYPERASDAATTRLYFTTWAHELLDDH